MLEDTFARGFPIFNESNQEVYFPHYVNSSRRREGAPHQSIELQVYDVGVTLFGNTMVD
jgi:hypothetical protein